MAGAVAGAGDRRGERRDQDQTHQTEHAIDQHDRGRQRLGPRRPRGIANPNHVAADVARQKVVEEQRDQQRSEQRSGCGRWTSCASSSSCQRHVLASTLTE